MIETLTCGARTLDLSAPVVMGILNVTPDSFSDGGRFTERDAALRQAERMLADGAAIIDVGGESTRPGAAPVSEQQELDRVVPVVEALTSELDALVSVDTSTAAVIRGAAAAGAGMINDVRALRRSGALDAAAASGLPVCLMHMQGEPGNMQDDPRYQDVTAEVVDFLRQRIAACGQVGIPRERLLVDPGFGFARYTAWRPLHLSQRTRSWRAPSRSRLANRPRRTWCLDALRRPKDRTPGQCGYTSY